LLQNHGVFAIGKSAKEAVKAAVMTEDVAHTTWLAMQIGTPLAIAPEHVAHLHRRYQTCYGQAAEAPAVPAAFVPTPAIVLAPMVEFAS
jgi:ribulose-5-phosphate 4-epimerase/fuculose-1-phosphate aldolase